MLKEKIFFYILFKIFFQKMLYTRGKENRKKKVKPKNILLPFQ